MIDAEHTRRVAAQKAGFGVSVEPEIVDPLKRLGGSYHGIVGPEHDLASAVTAHVLHQFRRIASDRIGRRVDVDIFVFGSHRDHFRRPGITNVASDDDEVRDVERHPVEVGNGPTGLRGAQRPRMTHLRAKGNAEARTY